MRAFDKIVILTFETLVMLARNVFARLTFDKLLTLTSDKLVMLTFEALGVLALEFFAVLSFDKLAPFEALVRLGVRDCRRVRDARDQGLRDADPRSVLLVTFEALVSLTLEVS